MCSKAWGDKFFKIQTTLELHQEGYYISCDIHFKYYHHILVENIRPPPKKKKKKTCLAFCLFQK